MKPTRNIDGVIRPNTQVRSKRRLNYRLLSVVGLIAIIALTAYIVLRRHEATLAEDGQLQSVITTINRHYVLPTDEEPALATVTDQAKVSSAFGNKAKNGDRILIYQKNAQAVVYRPDIDRVVAVVPVTIDTPKTGQTVQ